MKKILLLLITLFLFGSKSTQALDASISYATFKTEKFSFLEVYLNVMGTTIDYHQIDSLYYQGAVNVLILIKNGEEIVQYEKYKLSGPVSRFPNDFMDVRRFPVEHGKYTLQVTLVDANKEENTALYEKEFEFDYAEDNLLQSDIQLIGDYRHEASNSMFVKNGLHLEPLPYNFYYKDATHLIFYQEVYNSDKAIGDKFLLRYIIEQVDGNGKTEAVMMGNKKLSPKPVNVVLVKKDITKLESGNYNLLVEVRNRAGDLLSSKTIPFQRSNPYLQEALLAEADLEKEFVADLSAEDLRYSLKALAPIVYDNSVEVLNMVISNNDVEAQRRYLFSFWGRLNPNNPEESYNQYMEVARAVDKKYDAAFGHGFESDRGHIFMKYGKPSDVITVENEPSAPPYEIWVYEEVPTTPPQGNVKFLFYNPSLAGGNYQLLHSTCRGEIQNPRWAIELYSNDNDVMNRSDIDSETVSGGFNRRALEYFNDF